MAKYIDLVGLNRFLDRLKTLVIAFKLKKNGAAEMDGCSATGSYSVAEGVGTTASGQFSHAEGFSTTADEQSSHAEGFRTTADGESSHAEGFWTTAKNKSEHAEGYFNVSHSATTTYGSSGNTQHSVGIGANGSRKKNAFEIMQNGDIYLYGVGDYEGNNLKTDINNPSNTIQDVIKSLENDSVWEAGTGENSVQRKGTGALANGMGSVAEGEGQKISFTITSVEEVGEGTTAFHVQESTDDLLQGDLLHYKEGSQDIWTYVARAENNTILVTERFTPTPTSGGTLEVLRGIAYGQNSHSENAKTTAFGENSHAEGFLTNVRGFSAHGEGVKTRSNGWASHAEGQETESSGIASHSEGEGTKAIANDTHAEGYGTTASANSAHAEGYNAQALGLASHSEGFGTSSQAVASHAEGYETIVAQTAQAAHAEGYGTVVNNVGEHAEGVNNVSHVAEPTPQNLPLITRHSVGIGTPAIPEYQIPETHLNAFEIMANGDAYLIGVGEYTGTTINSQWTLQSVIGNLTTQIANLTNQINAIKEVTDHLVYDPVNKCINFVFDEE